MTNETIIIRLAMAADAKELVRIYAPYVEKTAISFEYEVPGVEEFQGRIAHTLQRYPYLVAEKQGEILGYAYAGAFKGRTAYDWAAEVSIYLKDTNRKQGIGRKLYAALEAVSQAQNIVNLNACIGKPIAEDAHLNHNSMEFHAHMGYRMVGEFHQCGYKFSTWYDMVWMEKIIGEHKPVPDAFRPFPELRKEELRQLGIEEMKEDERYYGK